MDIKTAQENIGKPFKYALCAHWDTIRSVDTVNGSITGDILIMAPIEDCRLKQPMPEGLKKHLQSKNKTNE